ncbi:hypothetical protein DWQ67_05845 [Galactobacter caseinivorans]|uniref:Metallopeptidase family protein n=1 Tax=Galactobacter caseinivorans TaxID=2676123 RepID=A0A496PK78_9MICC|nr:hypothetical protein DWQ67_05845 [Galactobacter caseinivorans]
MPRQGHGRRRDRRGRSGRGSLLPPGVPASLTRQERFEDLVTDSAERLRERWGTKVERMSFEVAFVPDAEALLRAEAEGEAPPLGASLPGRRQEPPRVIVFRRPLETVAGSAEALPWLVHDVVVELVAELLAMPPERVDPDYRGEPPEQDD